MTPQTEDDFLRRLAEHPFDSVLRHLFADWLLEQGDPRGEVIALSLKGELQLTERRRVARLTEQHSAKWLGTLASLAEPALTKFTNGFLSTLGCQVPLASATWQTCAKDPRLATVTNLVLPGGREASEVGDFLRSAWLKSLARVQASVSAWSLLAEAPAPVFTLETAALSSWGTFHGELDPLARVPCAMAARRLELVTSEFVNPIAVADMRAALLNEMKAVSGFDELVLNARFGVVEGAVAWLLSPTAIAGLAEWPGSSWGIAFGDCVFRLQRAPSRLSTLEVDLRHDDDLHGLGQRIATAASVLVLLAQAGCEAVDVVLPGSARLRSSERDVLRAAVKRLRTVTRFVIGGTPVPV